MPLYFINTVDNFRVTPTAIFVREVTCVLVLKMRGFSFAKPAQNT